MDGSTAVWLALTLAAPVTLVPEIALLRLLHSRRAAWHPLDVLIVSLLVGQLCCTLVTFGLSASALMKNAGLWASKEEGPSALCAALVSFWAAAHTMHAATLSSLAVDRAMTIRWPYKYRLSVRRTQIRYHVVVLAVVSLLVGVAALFANGSSSPSLMESKAGCHFLPYAFDSRFSLFWLCLHGILLVSTLTAGAVIAVTRIMIRCCPSLGLMAGSGSDMRTLGNASEGSSSAATLPLPRYTPGPAAAALRHHHHHHHSVAPALGHPNPAMMFGNSLDKTYSSNLTLHHHHHMELLDSGGGGGKAGPPVPADYADSPSSSYGNWNRQRHSTVAAVLIVAYTTHHVPLLVLTTLGTYFSGLLPPDWPYSAMVLSSSLLSGLLFMAVLVFIDPVTRGWMVDSLKPSRTRRAVTGEPTTLDHLAGHGQSNNATATTTTGPPTKIAEEESRYRMSQIYSHEPTELLAGKFPLTNGSLFVHLMNPPASNTSSSSSSATDARANRRPSRMGVSAYDRHQQQQQQQRAGSICHLAGPYPMMLEAGKPPLSTFMSRSRILLAAETSASSSKPIHQAEGLYGNDHSIPVEPIYASLSETLSSYNTLDSVADPPVALMMEDDEGEGSATESAGDDFEFHNIRSSRQTLIPSASTPETPSPVATFGLEDLKPRSRIARSATYRILCNGLDVKCAKRDDPTSTLSAVSESQHGLVTCVTLPVEDDEDGPDAGSLRRSKLLTSLSMNDIDILGDEDHVVGAKSNKRSCSDQSGMPARSDSLFSLPAGAAEDEEDKGSKLLSSCSPLESKSLIRSSVELSRRQEKKHLKRGPPPSPHYRQEPQQHQSGMLHFRKKSNSSIHNRSRTAVLQRFHQRRSRDNGIVTIAALKAALSQSSVSYLDTGDALAHHHNNNNTKNHQQQQTAVFVSEYL